MKQKMPRAITFHLRFLSEVIRLRNLRGMYQEFSIRPLRHLRHCQILLGELILRSTFGIGSSPIESPEFIYQALEAREKAPWRMSFWTR
jgi:hypothetical protein